MRSVIWSTSSNMGLRSFTMTNSLSSMCSMDSQRRSVLSISLYWSLLYSSRFLMNASTSGTSLDWDTVPLVLNETDLRLIAGPAKRAKAASSEPKYFLFFNLAAYDYLPEERIAGQSADVAELERLKTKSVSSRQKSPYCIKTDIPFAIYWFCMRNMAWNLCLKP